MPRVASLAVGGCIENRDVWLQAASLIEAVDPDAVTVVGDFVCTGSVEGLSLLRGRWRLYYLPGRLDDPFIARLLEERAESIEGRAFVASRGVVVAGVGGREPLMNLERIVSILSSMDWPRLILFSYHPPHGVLDYSSLGARKGLHELHRLRKWLAVHFFSDCSSPGAVLREGRLWWACLPRLRQGCIQVYEDDAGVRTYCI